MPNYSFLLASLGLQSIKGVIYNANEAKELPSNASNFPNLADSSGQQMSTAPSGAVLKSDLNTTIFCDLWLHSGKTKADDSVQLVTFLCDVAQSKNIVLTPMVNKDNTIKEYINDGDMAVTIKGMIVNPTYNSYPKEEVRKLRAMLSIKKPLTVVCEYLALFNIYNLVITDYSFPQTEGYQNAQAFEINAIQDTPVYLNT